MPAPILPHHLYSPLLDDEAFGTLLRSLARSRSFTIISNPPEPIDDIDDIEIEDGETFRKQMLTRLYKSVRKNIVTE